MPGLVQHFWVSQDLLGSEGHDRACALVLHVVVNVWPTPLIPRTACCTRARVRVIARCTTQSDQVQVVPYVEEKSNCPFAVPKRGG